MPLIQVAHLEKSVAPTLIERKQGQRLVSVSAAVEPRSLIPNLQATLQRDYFPQLQQKYPHLKMAYGGRQQDEQESKSSLLSGLFFTFGQRHEAILKRVSNGSSLISPASDSSDVDITAQFLPMHLPSQPCDWHRGLPRPSGRRRQRRLMVRKPAWELLEWAIAAFSYYEL